VAARHRSAAALPSGTYTRPASLDDTGLVVTVYGESGGVERTFDFTGLAGSVELRRAFAAAFDRDSGPGGAWRSGVTCVNVYNTIRRFLRHLADQNPAPATPDAQAPGRN
jgi:hypothetical protein